MNLKKKKDYAKVASREKRYATLAREEGEEALKRSKNESKSHLKASARDSAREASNAFKWAKKRTRWSKEAKAKESSITKKR